MIIFIKNSHRLNTLFINKDPEADDRTEITDEVLHRNLTDAVDLHAECYR